MKARPNAVLAVVAALVVIMAVVAGYLAANRSRPELDAATPDGTTQLYVLAIVDADDETALTYLDPDLGCTAPMLGGYRPSRMSMAVVATDVTGDRARVVLELTDYSNSGPLDPRSHRETFELKASGDRWLIGGTPWPVYACK